MQDVAPEKITQAILTCPECGEKQEVTMPTEGKQHFFKCGNEECSVDISIKEGECCIFCSYSDTKCPAKQINPTEDEKPKLQSLI